MTTTAEPSVTTRAPVLIAKHHRFDGVDCAVLHSTLFPCHLAILAYNIHAMQHCSSLTIPCKCNHRGGVCMPAQLTSVSHCASKPSQTIHPQACHQGHCVAASPLESTEHVGHCRKVQGVPRHYRSHSDLGGAPVCAFI
jgi:hypothetical protein